MNDFDYSHSRSLSDAVNKRGVDADKQYIAGGTNLIDLMKYHLLQADELIDVSQLGNHTVLALEGGGVMLDAFATNADTAYDAVIAESYPLLSKAILAGASAQIRNMASNGGNLLQRTRCYYFYDANSPCNKRVPGSGCSAIKGYNRNMAILGTSEHCIAVFPSDMCVALAALEAKIHLKSAQGDRTIDFEDFHRLPGSQPEIDNNLKPGELIVGIELPKEGFPQNYSYLKLRDRASYAFALVSVACGFKIIDHRIQMARIAVGGVAHKPWRVKEAEHFLIGKVPSKDLFRSAAEMIIEGAIGFEHNQFKIELAKRAIVRNCVMALDPSSQLPGAQPSLNDFPIPQQS